MASNFRWHLLTSIFLRLHLKLYFLESPQMNTAPLAGSDWDPGTTEPATVDLARSSALVIGPILVIGSCWVLRVNRNLFDGRQTHRGAPADATFPAAARAG